MKVLKETLPLVVLVVEFPVPEIFLYLVRIFSDCLHLLKIVGQC